MADEQKMSASEKKKEDWMNSKWRPMMGWMYMVVCIMDMVIFPILWSILQAVTHTPITQWNPLTLQGAGLFHIAMGAVLGLAAWGRTQEKLNGANNGGLAPVSQSVTTTFGAPSPGGFGSASSGFGSTPSPAPSGFGGGGFGSTPSATPAFGAPPAPMKPVGAPLPGATNPPTGNPTKTPAAVDNPDA